MIRLLNRFLLIAVASVGCAAPQIYTSESESKPDIAAVALPTCISSPTKVGDLNHNGFCGIQAPYSEEVAARLARPDPLANLSLVPSANHPYDFVVLVSLDGFRPDVITQRTPTLLGLRQNAMWANNAFTIQTSNTLPSHAAMVSGVDVDTHGVNFNAYRPGFGAIRFPSVMQIVKKAGLPIGMFVAKYKLIHLIESDSAETFYVGGIRCQNVAQLAAPFIEQTKEGMAFVHFSETDAAGHRYGWMSGRYAAAATQADRCIRSILDSVNRRENLDRTLVIVTADHGGHGRRHMGAGDVDRRIPWIAISPRLHGTQGIDRDLSTMDTAATVLTALGLPLPHGMAGTPVTEALEPLPQASH